MFANIDRRWVNDDESDLCTNCNEKFTFLNRKHHCRACGKLLCHACASNWLLIPSDRIAICPGKADDSTNPQRCCHTCARVLQPKQEELLSTNCKANTELRIERGTNERYANPPVSRKFETDLRKATYTLYNFTSDNAIEGQDSIPRELIAGAKGLVFVTVLKAGFLFSGRVGTGLVIARLADGSWSAPSAIMLTGIGWGLQAGGEVTDVIIILATQSAVDAFTSEAQVSVGTELAISVGPVGRSAGTDLHAGSEGASAAFSYAHSKGLFCGVSLEASVFTSRQDINRNFYGSSVQPATLLSGSVLRPKAADPLYQALHEVQGGSSISSSSAPSLHGTYSYITAAGEDDDDEDESEDEGAVIKAMGNSSWTESDGAGDKHSSSGDETRIEHVQQCMGTELADISKNGSFGRAGVLTSYSDLAMLASSHIDSGRRDWQPRGLLLSSSLGGGNCGGDDSDGSNSDDLQASATPIPGKSKPIPLVATSTSGVRSSAQSAESGPETSHPEASSRVASSMHYEEIRL